VGMQARQRWRSSRENGQQAVAADGGVRQLIVGLPIAPQSFGEEPPDAEGHFSISVS
jgi:hypothetical protein